MATPLDYVTESTMLAGNSNENFPTWIVPCFYLQFRFERVISKLPAGNIILDGR